MRFIISLENREARTVFVELNSNGLINGQKIDVRAERSGVLRYKTVMRTQATIERWLAIRQIE